MSAAPHIDGAPGITWIKRKVGWEARWVARPDLTRRGYLPKSAKLWHDVELGPIEEGFIRDRCVAMQAEMLRWLEQIAPATPVFNGTLSSLIACYQADPVSGYSKRRYATKQNYDYLCRRLRKDHGTVTIADIKYRTLLVWHDGWSAGGKVALGHSLIGMLRTLVRFGATIMESDECARVAAVLHAMKFQMPAPRSKWVNAEQAQAIIDKALELGVPSIALAQAFQFECTLRQKDVIGEWVPLSEAGVSDIISGNTKWHRGLRWEEISRPDLVLHHITSKKNKLVEPPLQEAPMVLEAFKRIGELPTRGPIIVSEFTRLPYTAFDFRRRWRAIARQAGVPDDVYNMDTRAGAITEATDAGVPLEHARHMATHSNTATTAGYSRNPSEKVGSAMRGRVQHRIAKAV